MTVFTGNRKIDYRFWSWRIQKNSVDSEWKKYIMYNNKKLEVGPYGQNHGNFQSYK